MTVTEAATYTGYTHAWVRQLIRSGHIAAEKRGRDWHVEQDELDRYQREKLPSHRPARATTGG